jgi:transcriptional regulator with XRE-family HTH domain
MNGLTQRDVAELNGFATSTYNFIENGERTPTMAEFSHLCAMMGFDAQDFFKASEKVKNGNNKP